MATLAETRLILFFTTGVSLRVWDDVGMLKRELEIYRRLRLHLKGISFLSYGNESELNYVNRLDGIEVLYNPWTLPSYRWFVRLAPFLYHQEMRQSQVFKTNQIRGSEAALFAKRLFKKRLIVRCGYVWSMQAKSRTTGRSASEIKQATALESRAFTAANCVVVTTPPMKQYVVNNYGLPDEKVSVIPNYVLTDLFKPASNRSTNGRRLCFVGRLSLWKNPLGLLEAIEDLEVELLMIGSGPLYESVKEKVRSCNLRVHLLGNLPHNELPLYLNSSDLFVLPSLFSEGHPKTLLEAMACGLPVIGTNVPGICELIEHRQTGFLCGTSPTEIRAAIQEVMGDKTLRVRMGQRAREFVVENFSIDKALELELNLLDSLIKGE